MIFLGAGNMITPLGTSVLENWEHVLNYATEIKPYASLRPEDPKLYLSRFSDGLDFHERIKKSIRYSLEAVDHSKLDWSRTVLIFSSTKGDVEQLRERNIDQALLDYTANELLIEFPAAEAITVSNACISGITALILAHDLVKTKQFTHALVVAADNCSTFVSEGFKSFYAIASDFCKPYDAHREGINLGEGVAAVWISGDAHFFVNEPIRIHGGATANDANHISGPSRTGEGLFRATSRALKFAGKTPDDIDYISAHGTATRYNDDMESMAVDRLGLNQVPMNSLKGYFGHTLGAAGLIETLMAVEQMQHNIVLGTKGFDETGTVKPVNVFSHHQPHGIQTIIKNGSGFGGCNAAIVLEKWK
jgi:3-oxoacyl-[acyl-carrier-protein] synthase-1